MSNEHRNARRRGKDFERLVGRALGGKRRIGYKGTACSDLDGVPWSVECTRTNKGVAAVRAKWAQAVTNARLEGQEPVLVIALPRQPLLEAFVGLRFGLFQQLVLAASGHPALDTRQEDGDHEEADPDPEDDAVGGSGGTVDSVHRITSPDDIDPIPGGVMPARYDTGWEEDDYITRINDAIGLEARGDQRTAGAERGSCPLASEGGRASVGVGARSLTTMTGAPQTSAPASLATRPGRVEGTVTGHKPWREIKPRDVTRAEELAEEVRAGLWECEWIGQDVTTPSIAEADTSAALRLTRDGKDCADLRAVADAEALAEALGKLARSASTAVAHEDDRSLMPAAWPATGERSEATTRTTRSAGTCASWRGVTTGTAVCARTAVSGCAATSASASITRGWYRRAHGEEASHCRVATRTCEAATCAWSACDLPAGPHRQGRQALHHAEASHDGRRGEHHSPPAPTLGTGRTTPALERAAGGDVPVRPATRDSRVGLVLLHRHPRLVRAVQGQAGDPRSGPGLQHGTQRRPLPSPLQGSADHARHRAD